MNRAGRFLRRAVLAALILLVGLVLWWAGERIYPRLLEIAARDYAGIALSVRGPVSVQLWPEARISASDLDVAAAASTAWAAQLQKISVQIDARSALRGRLVIERIELQGARVQVEEVETDGAGMLDAAPGLAQARIRIDDARVEIKTAAGQQPRTIQIDHYTSGPGADGQPHLKARGSVDGGTLSVDARFSAEAERVGGVMAFPLTASVSIPGWKLDGTAQGHVVSPLAGKGLMLETTLDIGDVGPLAQILDLADLPSGRLKLHASLDGDLPAPRLAKVEATLENGKALNASVEGAGIALASGAVESLHLRFKASLPVDGSRKRSAVRQIDVDATLNGSPGHYKVKLKRAREALNAKTWLEGHGTFELAALADWAAAQSQLDVQAKTPSISALSDLLGGGPRSHLGPVELRGRLTGTLASATLKNMQLRIGADGPVRIVAKGQAGPFDLSRAKNAAIAADVQVEMQVREAKALQANPRELIVKLQPWAGHARLRLAPAHWRLTGLDVKAGSERSVQVNISGKASGRGDLLAGIQRLVTGALKKGDSAELDVVLKTASAKATGQMIGVNVPELGALQGRAHVQEENGALAMRGLVLQSEGELALKLAGDIGALSTLQDVELKLTLAPTMHDNIDRLLDLELPLNGDVSLQATLRRPGQQVLSVDGGVQVGSSKLALVLTAERTATVPLVKGRIHSASILAADFWPTADAPSPSPSPAPSAAAPEAARPSKTAASSGGLGPLGLIPGLDFVLQGFPGEPQPTSLPQGKRSAAAPVSAAPATSGDGALPWSRLQHVDIALDVHVDTVRGVHLDGGPLKFRLVDQAGRLEFGPAQLDFKGGSVTLHGVADANDKPPSVMVEGKGKDLPVAELAAHSGVKSSELDGQLSFNYDLKARGQSLVDLRASLNGEIDALVEHGKFPLEDLDRLSGSVLDWLTSWMPGGEQTQVPCAVSRFSIKDGLAEAQTLYLKTERSAAYGIGTIDLRSDTLDLTITPKVSGISLSPPPTVRIHGPLADPDVDVANASAVLLRYGEEVATSMAFPPAILLRHLFGRATSSDSTPCR